MAQVSDNSDFIEEEGCIVNNARVQSNLVIEDHGVPVDTPVLMRYLSAILHWYRSLGGALVLGVRSSCKCQRVHI